ncbi:MAG TPA: hypothetical protein VHX65_20075 [Pirellulales bacterium]|nr:hypothetical protein [Pirellulales bacterium]
MTHACESYQLDANLPDGDEDEKAAVDPNVAADDGELPDYIAFAQGGVGNFRYGSLISTEGDTGSITIPAGYSSVTIVIEPIDNVPLGNSPEWDKIVSLSLLTNADYSVDDAAVSATVTIVNQDGVSGLLNRNIDTENTGLQAQTISNGSVSVNVQQGTPSVDLTLTPSGIGPVYNGNTNLQPIISVDMQLPAGPVPTALSAQLDFGGDIAPAVTYDTADLSDYEPGETLHFVLEGSTSIATELASGHYDYTVVFTATIDDEQLTRTVIGGTEIVNLTDNSVGTSE